jgi:DNA-binding phage protein
MEERMSYLLVDLAPKAVAPQAGYCGNYLSTQAEASTVQEASNESATAIGFASLTSGTENVLLLFKMDGDHYRFQDICEVQVEQTGPNGVIEIAQIVERAKTVLGLNNVQLAKIVGVSRPSLYNHISGKEQPKSMEGYTKLYTLLSRVDEEVGGNISSGIKSVLVDGKTLLSRLKFADFDEDDFIRAAQTVAKRMDAKSGSTSISNSRQKSVTRYLGSMG